MWLAPSSDSSSDIVSELRCISTTRDIVRESTYLFFPAGSSTASLFAVLGSLAGLIRVKVGGIGRYLDTYVVLSPTSLAPLDVAASFL